MEVAERRADSRQLRSPSTLAARTQCVIIRPGTTFCRVSPPSDDSTHAGNTSHVLLRPKATNARSIAVQIMIAALAALILLLIVGVPAAAHFLF